MRTEVLRCYFAWAQKQTAKRKKWKSVRGWCDSERLLLTDVLLNIHTDVKDAGNNEGGCVCDLVWNGCMEHKWALTRKGLKIVQERLEAKMCEIPTVLLKTRTLQECSWNPWSVLSLLQYPLQMFLDNNHADVCCLRETEYWQKMCHIFFDLPWICYSRSTTVLP